ncbi:MAG: PD-(D/E)XK nuclease family protein [Bacteroidota bacterium]
MISFLDCLITDIQHKVTSDSLIIVPTRRAAIQIERKLGQLSPEPGFLPTCIPVADLMDLGAGIPIADDTRLLIDLYTAYQKIDQQLQLDEFIKWGDQILSDFDEIDRNLIDTDKLFKRIVDAKEIEFMFSHDEYETELLNRFWKEFSMTPLSKLKLSFLSYWEILPVLYKEFQQLLQQKGYCYEGFAWRNTAQSIQNNNWFKQFDAIVFAGFYALTKSEEVIINYLVRNNNASVYIDADTYYTENKNQEAGNYLRKGIHAEVKNFIGTALSNSTKEIKIIKSNGSTAMAKDIGLELIQQFEHLPPDKLADAVVVLPDDTLLIPLLQVLDKKNIPYNPSMGMALSNFPLLAFIKKIKNIRTQLMNSESNIESIVGNLFDLNSFNNLFLVLHKSIDDLKSILLIPTNNFNQEHVFLLDLLKQFANPTVHYQKQILNCVKNEITKFGNQLINTGVNISITSYWTLLINHLHKIRIPIEANEGEGININGFLETRLTDYTDVYIANVNEGTLPSKSVSNSLIPYALRKFYSLPCKEEQEAVTAYHFYRLLQRSERVSLFYTNQMTATGGGEKSRFIFQIENELSVINKNITVSYLQYQTNLIPLSREELAIEKSEDILQKMRDKYLNVDISAGTDGKGFSPSSLASYIFCPLKFYLEQFAKLRNTDDKKVIDQMLFGRILHTAMETIYKNHKQISPDFYKQIDLQLNQIVEDATRKEFSNKKLTGNDYLLQGVIKELIKKIVLIDKQSPTLEIISIEETFAFNFKLSNKKEVLFKGVFDRLDIVNDQIRILDYKTGSGEITIPKDLQVIFKNTDYKIVFQLLLYVYIYKNNLKRNNQQDSLKKDIITGAYLLKKNVKSITFLEKGKSISDSVLDEFESLLMNLLNEIFDPGKPFYQTDDIRKCGYCDFKNICNR